jgi:hypothetical protein
MSDIKSIFVYQSIKGSFDSEYTSISTLPNGGREYFPKDIAQKYVDGIAKTNENLIIENANLKREREEILKLIQEAYEVWVGSEGFEPKTAPEAYQQKLIKGMSELLKEALEIADKEGK